jgi:hypothetical protein
MLQSAAGRKVAQLQAKSARACLQGCLGWDHKREKKQGSYPATVTSDKWFVLASRTQHILATLQACNDFSGAGLLAAAKYGAVEEAQSHLAEAIDQLQGALAHHL